MDDVIPFLPYLVPVLVDRIGSLPPATNAESGSYGAMDVVEPSEEIRLQMVLLLDALVERGQGRIAPCVEDIVAILCRTFADSYPEVKKVLLKFDS